MAANYSSRDFLRRAANTHLARYFSTRSQLTHLDFSVLAETDVEPIQSAIDSLPDQGRSRVDGDFQMIHDLATDVGIQVVLELAEDLDDEGRTAAEIGEQDDLVSQVFHTFLEHAELFHTAWNYFHADSLPRRYWRKRKAMPDVPPPTDAVATGHLADALSAYFRHAQGRGRSCKVDVYTRGDRTYYFGFLEDYGRDSMEWDAGGLQRRPHRPAFEVIFVHSRSEATLDLFVEGPKRIVNDLQVIFGRVILGVELGPPERDERVYQLNPFKSRGFNFVYGPEQGIQDVRVKKLRFSVMGGKGRSITLNADSSISRYAVYDLMEDVLKTGAGAGGNPSPGIPLALVNVTQVGIKATFALDRRGRRTSRSFDITYPNRCSLRYDAQGNLLREILRASGIEPVDPRGPGLPL